MRRELWQKQWKLVFHKQLHFFAVDILMKMCNNDCRIKSAFQRKWDRILSGVSLVLRDLQAGASGRFPNASGRFLVWPESFVIQMNQPVQVVQYNIVFLLTYRVICGKSEQERLNINSVNFVNIYRSFCSDTKNRTNE